MTNDVENLRKSYDDDINTLRKMLKDARSYNSSGALNNSADHTTLSPDYFPASTNNSYIGNILSPKYNSSQLGESFKECKECGTDFYELKKERDELLRRFRLGEASRATIEERKELERQLHNTKMQLFRHQQQSREKFEDIEEQLEHAQRMFDEKINEKDLMIESLQEEIEKIKLNVNSKDIFNDAFCQTANDVSSLSFNELKNIDSELKVMEDKFLESERLAELCNEKLQQEVERFKSKYKNSEKMYKELKRNFEDGNKVIKSLKISLKENEESILKVEDLLLKEKQKFSDMKSHYEEELKSLQKLYNEEKSKNKKSKSNNEMKQKKVIIKHEATIKEFQNEISELKDKLNQMNRFKENFDEEKKRLKQNQRLNEDYLIEQNSKLENKLAFVQKELAEVIEKNSRLDESLHKSDSCLQKKITEAQSELNSEVTSLKDKLQRVENELKNSNLKSKESVMINKHRDYILASSIQEECNKLSILCDSINPTTNYNRGSSTNKGSSFSSKKSLLDLQDVVELVCRSSNDLLCEVNRLRRESDVNKEYMKSCEDLSSKRSYGKSLKSSKDRFGSYDTLIKSYDFDKFSRSDNNAWKKDLRKARDNNNTVKLLSRLQGRVKQMRPDGSTISKTASFISQTP